MKNLFIAFFLLLTGYLSAQTGTYGCTFTDPQVLAGNKFRVTIGMVAGVPFNLGSTNFRFNFNQAALANVVVVSDNFPSPDFGTTTTTGSSNTSGTASINTAFNGSANSSTVAVGTTNVPLVTVEFTIINSALTTNLVFRQTANPKTTALDDDKVTSLIQVPSLFQDLLNVSLQNPGAITVNAGADVTVNCTNPSTTLTAVSTPTATSYAWSTGETTAAINVTPTTTTTYSVTVTSSTGTTATDDVIVTVNKTAPTANAGSDVTVDCTNPSTTLTATGGGTYAWDNGATQGGSVTPTTTTTYTVTVTAANGCTATDDVVVTVDNAAPTANAGSDVTVNCTSPFTFLLATGGISYAWDNGATQGGMVSPLSTTTYTVTVTGANGCTATDDIIVTVDNTPPTANAGADVTIDCTNLSATLTATGGGTYAWDNGATQGGTVMPTATTTYTVTVTSANGCTSTDAVVVTVDNAAPIANAGADVTLGCASLSTSLTATGGVSYAWSNGATTASTTVSPTTTTTYIVTVTGANGCTAIDDVIVNLDNTPPTANAGADVTIDCTNPAATLTATGGVDYAWSSGPSQGSSVFVSPTTTTTYTVTVTGANGCTSTDDVVVTVDKTAPTANAGVDVTVTCANPSTTLTATGGGTYAWDNGATQGGTVSPIATTTYTVTVTSANGCTATDDVVVTIDGAAPTADAGADVTVNCTTPSTTLTATGGVSYAWSNGATQGGSVTPTATTTYTVTVTGANGCKATDDVVVTVDNAAPTANAGADATVDCTTPSTTLTATGGVSYAWSNGATQGGSVTPTAMTTYTVTVTGANGCTSTDDVVVAVDNAVPTANAGADATVTCTTPSTTLTATGGVSYAWSNGATQGGAVTPTATTTYTVTVTGANGCTATDDVVVAVDNAAPTANAGADATVTCTTPSTTLTATGGVSYAWSNGATQGGSVTPTATTTYTVTATGANGCTATDDVVVTVDKTAPIANAGADATVNGTNQTSTTLTATGGVSYAWSNGATTASTTVSPTVTTTYTVTVTGANGCTATDAVVVTFDVGLPPAYDLSFVNPMILNGNKFRVTIRMSNQGTPFSLGANNLRFNFAQSALSNLTIISENFPSPDFGSTTTLGTNPTTGVASINTAYTGTANANLLPITNVGTDLVTIEFDITNPNATSNLIWRLTTTPRTVALDDDKSTTIAAGTGTPLNISLLGISAGADVTTNCNNPSATLTATGGTGFTWSTGETTASITVNPTSNTTYSVTGTTTAGAISTDEVVVTVDKVAPTANAGADVTVDCTNPSTILTATGGGTYAWDNGATQGGSVTPLTTTTYTVTVTGANGCTAMDEVVVTVDKTAPTANAGADVTVTCTTPSTTLTATGGGIYAWDNGATQGGSVTPTATTTYTVTVTSANGCTATDDVVVTVDKTAPMANAGADVTVTCTTPSTTLTATGGGTYDWSNGAIQGVSVTPTATTTYTVTVTGANGCTATDDVVVTVDQNAPTANAGTDVTVNCTNPSATLTATGGVDYAWSSGPSQGGSVSVTPTVTTTYTVTVTGANGCTATDDVVVTVDNAVPTANAGADVTVDCTNPSTILTATGGGTYVWDNGATQGGSVSPSATTTYNVVVTGANGCTATDAVVVTADNTAPTANAGADATVNTTTALSATLTATGGGTYAWSNGATTASITVNPTATTTYTVTVTGANGCTATDAAVVTFINTTPPAYNLAFINPVVAGNKFRVTVSMSNNGMPFGLGASNFRFNYSQNSLSNMTVIAEGFPSPEFGATTTIGTSQATGIASINTAYTGASDLNLIPISATPTNLITIEFDIINNTLPIDLTWRLASSSTPRTTILDDDKTTTIPSGIATNLSMLLPSASADVTLTCTTPSATLTTNGGTAYQWSTGETTASINVTPTITTTYDVTITFANGYVTDAVVVTVDQVAPTANAGVDATVTCASPSTALTATGGVSYAWSNGALTAATSVTPTTATIYTVTVTGANGCTATDDVLVSVDQTAPTANAGVDATVTCTTPSTTLTATGGVSYAWSNGATTAATNVSPTISTNYTVTVTGANGCTATDEVSVTVDKTPPTVDAGADVTVTCTTPSTTLTATGGVSYVWSNGATQGGSVTPTTTTTYTVTATGTNGCTATDAVVVVVDKTAPTASAGAAVTVNCTTPSTTLTATGGVSYVWNNGGTQDGSVTPTVTTTYTVTVTGANGCTATATKVVTADLAAPTASAGAAVTVNCTTPSTILTATGGVSYAWNNGALQGDAVSPTVTTTYTVTVTGANGCTATANKVVTVDQTAPTANAGADVTVTCTTPSENLTATGGVSYKWSNGALTAATTVTPTVTTTYIVTVTGANGCTATDDVIVTVDKTAPTASAGAAVTVNCTTPSTTLTATGGVSYVWNNGGTQDGSVSPTVTTTYTVTVTGANGCTATASKVVTADLAAPPASAGTDVTVTCTTPSTTLTGTGGVSYTWDNGATQGSSVSPTVTTTYTVTVTGANGCTATASKVVTADKTAPTANAGADVTVTCTTPSATLTATGGVSYEWSNGALIAAATVSPTVTTTYTVTVTGANGCTATDDVIVTVDQVAPAANAGTDVTVTCTTPSTTLTATGGVSYAWSNTATQGGSVSPTVTTTYTVTATGANGCTATDDVIVTVDQTPPTVVAGSDRTTLTCLHPTATLTPNGAGYAWSGGSNVVSPTASTTYTVTATGANGCTATSSISITVINVATVSCPADITVNANTGVCYATNVNLGTPTSGNDCAIANAVAELGAATITSTTQFVKGTNTVTWTTTDVNGNVSTCNQIVTVIDVEMPSFTSVPSNVTLNCQDVIPSVSASSAIATDNCDTPTVTMASTSTKATSNTVCGFYNYSITNTWTATDASGNTKTASQVVTVKDVTAPSITGVPANVTVGSLATALIPATTTAVSASDNCAPVTVTVTDVTMSFGSSSPCTSFAVNNVHTWTATDVCGNTSTAVQIVTGVGAVALVCPANKTLTTNSDGVANYNCTTTVKAVDALAPTFGDNCDLSLLTHTITGATTLSGTGAITGKTLNKGINTVTYATTGAGMSNQTCTFTVTVNDLEKPKIVASTLTLNVCAISDVTVNTPTSVTDNCLPAPTITSFSDVTASLACSTTKIPKKITRTWTTTDASGNTGVVTQVINLRDAIAPTAIPKDVTVSVGNTNVSLPAANINNSSTDNCTTTPTIAISASTDVTASFAANVSITKAMGVFGTPTVKQMRLRVTDACGNASIGVSNVTIIRTVPLANNGDKELKMSETSDADITPTPTTVEGTHGSMKCFPNPFSDDLNINYTLTSKVEHLIVKVYDVQGKLVSTNDQGESLAGTYSMRWNLSNLQSGLYNICLELDGKCQKVERVIMMK